MNGTQRRTDEAQIRQRIEGWTKALRAKDLNELMSEIRNTGSPYPLKLNVVEAGG